MALIPGNLLSENNQSVETSVGGWASFSSVSSSVVQSTTQAFDGTHSVASTANATTAGALGGLVTTVDLPTVLPGVAYAYTYFVFSPKAAVFNANIDWYRTNNTTFVSSTNSTGQAVPVNTWTMISGGGIAPALAGHPRIYLQVTSGLAVSDVVFFDGMFFGQPVAAEMDRLFQPGSDPVSLAPWAGAPDGIHDRIVNAGTASITLLNPSTRLRLLLALSSESGQGATVTTFNDSAPLPVLLTPDDVTGGMQPWTGAPDSTAPAAVSATAGVASVTLTAQTPASGLGVLPGAASVTLTAQAPSAGLGALPGAGSVTVTAQAPSTALAVVPGAATATFTARAPAAGPAVLPGSASVSLTAQGPSTALAAGPGTAAVTLTAQAPTTALATFPGSSTVAFTGQAPATGLGAVPGTGSVSLTAQAPAAGLGALPGTGSVTLSGPAPSASEVDSPFALLDPLFLPDDPLGGMQPWSGAVDGIITGNAAVNAGVAAVTVIAQGPSTALAVGTGTAAVTVTGQAPAAGLGTVPGFSTVSFTALGPSAGLGAVPGTGAVALTGRTASMALAVVPGAAPLGLTAQNPSAAFSGTATAGRATVTALALSAASGVAVLPSAATYAVSARAPGAGLGALPGTGTVTLLAGDAGVTLPQVAAPTEISGREPQDQLHGRETPPGAGQENGPSHGRQPLSSTSGTEPSTSISGREP